MFIKEVKILNRHEHCVRSFKSRSLRPMEGSTEHVSPTSFKPVRDYYFFGSGPQGQLGNGSLTEEIFGVPTKTLVPSGGKLRIGFNHGAHISEDELVLKTWGFNQTGQLGLSHRDEVRSPSIVSGIHGELLKDVFCGTFQTFVISENIRSGLHHVWQFGAGYVSDNPDKFTRHTVFPVKLNTKAVFGENKVRQIIPGNDFCFFIDDKNVVYSMGDNDYGALGQDQPLGDDQAQFPRPSIIKTFQDIEVFDIQAGWNHAIARTSDGLYAWGNNSEGELGIDKKTPKVFVPRKIPFFEGINIVQISTGSTHCMALDSEGRVYVWGSNNDGKLGLNSDQEKMLVPSQIDSFAGEKIIKVKCGGEHSVALTDKGDVWVWGNGAYGQLSRHSRFKNSKYPLKLPTVSFDHDESGQFEELKTKTGKSQLSAKQIWNEAYEHRVTDIMCGASMTVFELSSIIKEDVRKVLVGEQPIQKAKLPSNFKEIAKKMLPDVKEEFEEKTKQRFLKKQKEVDLIKAEIGELREQIRKNKMENENEDEDEAVFDDPLIFFDNVLSEKKKKKKPTETEE